MNAAQRRIVTRTLFTVAALCPLLIVAAFLLFAGVSHALTDSIFIVLWFGWPVALIGVIAWLVGLYLRAGGQREARIPATTGRTPTVDPSSLDPMTIAGLTAVMWADKKRPFND